MCSPPKKAKKIAPATVSLPPKPPPPPTPSLQLTALQQLEAALGPLGPELAAAPPQHGAEAGALLRREQRGPNGSREGVDSESFFFSTIVLFKTGSVSPGFLRVS